MKSELPAAVLEIEASLLVRPCARMVMLAETPGLRAWLAGPAAESQILCAKARVDEGEPERWQLLAAQRGTQVGEETPFAQTAPITPWASRAFDIMSTQCVVDLIGHDTIAAETQHILLCMDQTPSARALLQELYEGERMLQAAHETGEPKRTRHGARER